MLHAGSLAPRLSAKWEADVDESFSRAEVLRFQPVATPLALGMLFLDSLPGISDHFPLT